MTSITSACHCKAFSHVIHLPLEYSTTALPQPHTTCNCTSCRRRTGQLAILPFFDPASTPDSVFSKKLHSYTTRIDSNSESAVRTYFCDTCGSKICVQVISTIDGSIKRLSWMLGCLDRIEVDGKRLIEILGHSFVNDTKDGGIANIWKQNLKRRRLAWYSDEEIEIKEVSSSSSSSQLSQGISEEKALHLHCRCDAFSVYVSRPNPTLPLPKNSYWYRPPNNDNGMPQRYMASWCACGSCRSTSGSCLPGVPYVQIPFQDIYTEPNLQTSYISSTMTSQTDLPNLTRYDSSSMFVARYFCSTCGASVLYFDGNRSFLGTFSAGLVDSPDGALAQSWLSWWTGIKGHPTPAIHCSEEGRERWGEVFDEFEQSWIQWGLETGQRLE